MADTKTWLEAIRLGKFVSAFVDAEIELEDLRDLTEVDLKELGLPLGPRRRFFRAVREQFAQGDPAPALPHDRAPQPASRGVPERRQLTVMFADLAGSTALSERLDPEELREINRSYQDAAKAAIEAFEGFVARYMGDGVLAYFGYPVAHEDDAERSIRAGLRLIDMLSKVGGNTELSVRVGVATGPVVVGDLIGEGASQESAVVGETPNLAARLQGLADPGSVLVSKTTKTLCGDSFSFRPLLPVTLKGFTEQVTPFQVLAERVGQTRFDARVKRGLSPFVGREEEMGLLRSRWTRASNGEGSAALIVGEPGIGKSRIVEEIRALATSESSEVVVFQCSSYNRNTAFHPLLAPLEARLLRSGTEDIVGQDGSRSLFGPECANPELYGRLLGALLNLELAPEEPVDQTSLDADVRRRQTIAALIDYLAFQCRECGMLCVFEDLHWADPSSLEFLAHLVARIADRPMLLLGTSRPGFTASWSDLAHCRVLSIGRLADSDVLALASSVSGLRSETVAQIADRAGGNPLFVEELAHALADSDVGDSRGIAIPATLQDSLMARLEATGIGRSVAQCAAVLGREFSESQLRAVWDGDLKALDSGVEAMAKAGLLYERNGPGGRREYSFKHALLRDAAYGTLLQGRRQDLHRSAAEYLLDIRRETPRAATYELIAQHFMESGALPRALDYWIFSGEAAARVSAYRECEAQLRRALSSIAGSDHPEQFETQELELLVLLGPALMALYGYSACSVGEVYQRARVLSETRLGKRHFTPILNALRLHNICRYSVLKGLEPANALLEYAEEIDDDASRIEGRKAVGSTFLWTAQFDAAREALAGAISLYDKGENMDVMRVDSDSGMTCHSFLSIVEWAAGNLDKSMEHGDRAETLARASNRAFGIGESLSFRAFLLYLHRQYEAAVQTATTAFELADEHNYVLWKSMSTLACGAAHLGNGHTNAGLEKLQLSQKLLADMGYSLWQPICLSQLARANGILGKLDEAFSLVESARSAAVSNEENFWLPEVYRIESEVQYKAGDQADAVATLRHAVELSKDSKNRMLELRTSTDLARRLGDLNSPGAVSELLEPICAAFALYPRNPDVIDANGTLAALT